MDKGDLGARRYKVDDSNIIIDLEEDKINDLELNTGLKRGKIDTRIGVVGYQ